jgi:tetratricopeptide (TPR) repeat protein
MPRRIVVLAFALAFTSALSAQRFPNSNPSSSPKQLTVKVVSESGPPMGMGIRVQLLNSTGTPVMDSFTNDQGEITFIVEAGSYRLRVTGIDIQEGASERSFFIDPRQTSHMEYFTVKKKVDPNQPSLEPYVSAAMLKIPDKAKSQFEKGMKALNKKDWEKAKEHLQKATEIYPQYAAAFNALGVVAMNTGASVEGREYFDRAINADPEYAASYVNRAKIMMGENDHAKAKELLNKSVGLDPVNPEALSMLSICSVKTGDGAMAVSSAERAHRLPHERFPIVHFVAGVVHETEQQFADAIREYKLFIEESRGTSNPTVERARASVAALEKK